ncbi:MAG: hypothetical protein KDA17_03870 [Candidatus Saccharibacteria bacterium]|nr:hypothetical protein [Candidatus Saccharibacteria bacterium]
MSCERNCFKKIKIKGRKAPLYFKGGGDADIEDTADQKALAKIAAERWVEYQRDFVPAENQYIDEMLNYDKESRQNNLESSSVAAVQAAYDEALDSDIDTLSSSGVNAGSGATISAINDNAADRAVAQTSNVNRTQQALQDQRVQGMKNVVALGNGQAAETLSGLNQIAANSASDAIDEAQISADRSRSKYGAIGTVAGMGARAALGSPDKEENS